MEVESTEPISVELLKKLAAKAPESQKHQSRSNGNHSFDLDDFIRRNGIAVKRQSEWNGGRRWILEVCPWNPEHDRGEAFVVQFANGAIAAGCQHNSCAGHNWHELRELYEPKAHAKNHTHPKGDQQQSKSRDPSLVLQEEALYGLAGDLVRTLLPYTESDPVALLMYFLTCFGNSINHGVHWVMERTKHFLNLFVVFVGDTSRGRKGTSRSTLDYVFEHVDREWRYGRVVSGLSSGPGLIWAVRDPVKKQEPVKDHGKITGYQEVIADRGVDDKRLLIVEEEFSSVLKAIQMNENNLSPNLRQAWDGVDLMSLVTGRKHPTVRATAPHISILAHITKADLLRHLDSNEQANGFGNRFLWFLVRRSKSLPIPPGASDEALEPFIEKLIQAKEFAAKIGELQRDNEAVDIWNAVYPRLTEDVPGLLGAITARGAPQVMRLASLYALLDLSAIIQPAHLKAALALWDYSFSSAQFIFGESLGDPIADKISSAITASEVGLSSTDLAKLFSNHNSSAIDAAVAYLLKIGAIVEEIIQTAGRPKTVYKRRPKKEQR